MRSNQKAYKTELLIRKMGIDYKPAGKNFLLKYCPGCLHGNFNCLVIDTESGVAVCRECGLIIKANKLVKELAKERLQWCKI